jgi:hypothetical protein
MRLQRGDVLTALHAGILESHQEWRECHSPVTKIYMMNFSQLKPHWSCEESWHCNGDTNRIAATPSSLTGGSLLRCHSQTDDTPQKEHIDFFREGYSTRSHGSTIVWGGGHALSLKAQVAIFGATASPTTQRAPQSLRPLKELPADPLPAYCTPLNTPGKLYQFSASLGTYRLSLSCAGPLRSALSMRRMGDFAGVSRGF